MTDIVERLRNRKEKQIVTIYHGVGEYEEIADSDDPDRECIEAADEIARLRAENERLHAELRHARAEIKP